MYTFGYRPIFGIRGRQLCILGWCYRCSVCCLKNKCGRRHSGHNRGWIDRRSCLWACNLRQGRGCGSLRHRWCSPSLGFLGRSALLRWGICESRSFGKRCLCKFGWCRKFGYRPIFGIRGRQLCILGWCCCCSVCCLKNKCGRRRSGHNRGWIDRRSCLWVCSLRQGRGRGNLGCLYCSPWLGFLGRSALLRWGIGGRSCRWVGWLRRCRCCTIVRLDRLRGWSIFGSLCYRLGILGECCRYSVLRLLRIRGCKCIGR